MKKSISYWSFADGLEGTRDITEAMVEAKRKGFDAIELSFAQTGQLTGRTTQSRCDRILADAKDIGIEISSLCTGLHWDISLTADGARERKRAYDLTVSYIEHARMLKLNAVLVIPGAVDIFFKPNFKRVQYDVVWKRSVRQLRKLAAVAARHRVHICIENVWNKFLLSPNEMRDFVDAVGSDWVGAYLDTANMMAYGYPEQWIRALGSRIKNVHFKDFKRSSHSFVNLLDGDTDWPLLMEEFRNIGYDSCAVHEVGGDRETLIDIGERMRKIVAM